MIIIINPATPEDNFADRKIKTKNFDVPYGIKTSTILFNPDGEQKSYMNFLTRILAECDNFPRTRDDLAEDDDFGVEFDTIETTLPDIAYNIPLERFLATRRWLMKQEALKQMNKRIELPGTKILLNIGDGYVIDWQKRAVTVGEIVWLCIMACQKFPTENSDVEQTTDILSVNFHKDGIECDLWME